MTIKVISLSLSFIFNLFFLTLLITGLTYSHKHKEEILRISLLEPFPYNNPPTLNSPPIDTPIKTPIDTSPPPLLQKSIKTKERKNNFLQQKGELAPEKEVLNHDLLKERLLALQEKRKHKDENLEEEQFIRERLATIKSDLATHKGSLKNFHAPSFGQTSDKIPEDYLLLIKRKFQTHFEVPIYLKNKPMLSALVEIETNDSGEIIRTTFIKKAEDQVFNRAVEKCLSSVNPLPVNKRTILRIEFKAEGSTKIL